MPFSTTPFSNTVTGAGINNRGDFFEEGTWEGGTATIPEVPAVPPVVGVPEIDLASASTYGTLAGSTITNTAFTVITGDVGLSPGTAFVGFPPGIVIGNTEITTAAAAQAKLDLTAAYLDAQSRTTDFVVSGDIGGTTKIPGVYTSASTLGITGTLTLDGGGDPQAFWIFQVGSALTTAVSSSVVVINNGGAGSYNVWWQVGTSATLGVTSTMVGTIMADQSITLNTNAVLNGRALTQIAAVTLDDNDVTVQADPVITPGVPAVPAVVTTTTGTITAGYGLNYPVNTMILTDIEQVDIFPDAGVTEFHAKDPVQAAIQITFTGIGSGRYHFEGDAA